MNRRRFLALGAAALAVAQPAHAKDIVAQIVRQLEKRGYSEITVSRTLLGRVRIVGRGSKGSREIILNPATGEILRDLTTRSDNSGRSGDLLDGGDDDGGGDGGGGDGGGGDDGGGDDGGDDDGGDDDGDDGDNSGSGGGGEDDDD
ncbi:hypothetical protein LHP98_12625 [Rhodobacter sp. Har01]|uniref:hypothetical protein n=1 Tax=Rhodobacter sp. Har01 TaxID=2883999 RepID=UPI001D06EEE7|nr:hypothetical protein [Rhodobacter sp. Har01]MCB6178968.1 hypothetical protein [Rhodobacter sp. Har01]